MAESIGLPPGVLNVVTADREVSELLVRDPRVDKITFTGSTAAGRRIASLCERACNGAEGAGSIKRHGIRVSARYHCQMARPSGAAMMVSAPFSTTTAPLRRAA